jgi:hypothetical protein
MFRQSTGHFQFDVCKILELYRSVHTASVYFLVCSKNHPEIDSYRVEKLHLFIIINLINFSFYGFNLLY